MDEDFNTDEALQSLGRLGKWHLVSYLYMASVICSSACFAMLNVVFIGAQPEHRCWLPNGFQPNESIPYITKDGKTSLDKCNIFENYSQVLNKTATCPDGWFYDTEVTGDTIVNEWDLVCDRSVLTETSQMVLVAGVMVGSVVGSLLADAFGRKLTFLMSVVIISVFSFITAWVENYYLFVVLRFFTGFFQQGVVLPGFVLACELFPASERTVAGMMIQNFWAIGMWVLALLAYLTKDWRNLLLACSFPGLLVIPSFWVISESIPWLVAKGRVVDAKKILERAARWNGVDLPEEYKLTEEEEKLLKIIDDSKDEGEGKKKKSLNVIFKGVKPKRSDKKEEASGATYTVADIFRSRRLSTFALMMCFLWCTSTFVYYGLSLNTGNLAGDPYINFFLSGLVEIPAYSISAVVLQLFGRRWPIFTFHMIAGVALFLTIFITDETALIALAMIGKFGISGCFGSVFLWAPELFPTTLRNVGIGIASLGGRVGNIVTPYTPFIARSLPWLPNVVFGAMCLIAGIFTLLLPETLGRPLPVTIEEVEKWTRTLSPEEKKRYKETKKAAKEKGKRAKENGPSSHPLTGNKA